MIIIQSEIMAPARAALMGRGVDPMRSSKKSQIGSLRDDRSGSSAMTPFHFDVRSSPETGHKSAPVTSPLWANNGHRTHSGVAADDDTSRSHRVHLLELDLCGTGHSRGTPVVICLKVAEVSSLSRHRLLILCTPVMADGALGGGQ